MISKVTRTSITRYICIPRFYYSLTYVEVLAYPPTIVSVAHKDMFLISVQKKKKKGSLLKTLGASGLYRD